MERQEPRPDAVVLNFGTPAHTLRAVRSLLASTLPPRRVWVVDNDPSDHCRTALSPVWTEVRYLKPGTNLGFSGGVNMGIRAALAHGADSVLVVNSDVTVPPETISCLQTTLARNPDAGIAGPLVVSDSTPRRVASRGLSFALRTGRMRHRAFGATLNGTTLNGTRHASETVDAVSGCFMLVRRPVFDQVGLFDEAYFFSFEDLDFCLRARDKGFRSIVTDDAVVFHQGGASLPPAAPIRLYYGARNHLRLAANLGRNDSPFVRRTRTLAIIALNLAYALRASPASMPSRIAAVFRGVRDHRLGRYGAGSG